MNQFTRCIIQVFIFLIAMDLAPALAQDAPKAPTDHQVPIATQWLLDAAGPTQRSSIKSVYLLVCPKTDKKGTAFLIKTGIIVTDSRRLPK